MTADLIVAAVLAALGVLPAAVLYVIDPPTE